MDNARVVISLSEGRMEFEGSEAFVEKQVANWSEVIKQGLAKAKPEKKVSGDGSVQKGAAPKEEGEESLNGYEELFAKTDTGIQVLKDLPGKNKAEKMVSAALLLSFANSLDGTESTPFESIREVCRKHGCLDSTNFASRIRFQKEAFVIAGKGSSATLKLTVPGKRRATELVKELSA